MQHQMQVMDPTGHTQVSWDSGDTAGLRVARETFDRMTGQGYRAFRVGKDGGQGERLSQFDPDAEEMILIPQLVGG
jgi:hypothetical protein